MSYVNWLEVDRFTEKTSLTFYTNCKQGLHNLYIQAFLRNYWQSESIEINIYQNVS